MQNEKFFVGVDVELIDGKAYVQLSCSNGMGLKDIQSCLVAGINLSIRGEKTPELQGKALKDIISLMESELVNVESFADLHISYNDQND